MKGHPQRRYFKLLFIERCYSHSAALHAHAALSRYRLFVALSSVRNMSGLVSKLTAAQLLHSAPLVDTRKFLFSERSLNELFMLIMLNATAPV